MSVLTWVEKDVSYIFSRTSSSRFVNLRRCAKTMAKKLQAVLDAENFRYIISPLKPGNQMDVKTIFRTIKDSTLLKWREIADFAGLRSASLAFRVAYLNNIRPEVIALSEYMVIDVSGNCAYFYDHEHKPASVAAPYVGPTITNNEAASNTVTENIPAKLTSRVTITDPLNRQLILQLAPTNGYIIGLNDLNLCNPDTVYQITGSPKTLNSILRRIHFVACAAGTGQIIITVKDPKSDAVAAIATTTVACTITAAVVESIPTITPPEAPTVTLNKASSFDPIKVADEDGKMLTVRITPFGCNLVNFKNYLGILEPGQVREIYGRPETINADLANVQVIALSENAQIAIELLCGKTRLLDYVVFTVDDGEGGEEGEGGEPEPEPVAPPTLSAQPTAYIGASGSQIPCGFAIKGGDADTKYAFKIVPNGCKLKTNTGSGNVTATMNNTPANITNWFSKVYIVPGDTEGTITVSIDDVQAAVIPVTGIPASEQKTPKQSVVDFIQAYYPDAGINSEADLTSENLQIVGEGLADWYDAGTDTFNVWFKNCGITNPTGLGDILTAFSQPSFIKETTKYVLHLENGEVGASDANKLPNLFDNAALTQLIAEINKVDATTRGKVSQVSLKTLKDGKFSPVAPSVTTEQWETFVAGVQAITSASCQVVK